ncbi:MAG: GGDEF domain-containing protein [Calditrichae bacterium]|nr:GGDEF domain-containing protein [Calditrichota bacterium]MCB9057575.1 GGDEF domain-containing protein [Calditrichia bacterium]
MKKIFSLDPTYFQVVFFSIIIIFSLGLIEIYMGYVVSLSIFYLLPISFTAWWKDKNTGIAIAFLSAIVWLIADFIVIHENTPQLILLINSILRLSFFIFVVVLITSLKNALEREQQLARKDFLTNTWNRLAFYEILEIENERALRYNHALTLVYLDLDNFKEVNDLHGHEKGDKLLIIVTKTISSLIRKTDSLARLGGDEFAVLLPETHNDSALKLLQRIQKELLRAMHAEKWGVTFSIGIVTFAGRRYSISAMIKEVDDLMYSVKKSGKNNIKQKIVDQWTSL